MKFGLTYEQFNFIDESVVKPLSQAGAKVFVFGSRARGDYQKFSDLDLMIESEVSKEIIKKMNETKEVASNSHFPFKIDLVHFSEFAESYKGSYQKDKVLWTKK